MIVYTHKMCVLCSYSRMLCCLKMFKHLLNAPYGLLCAHANKVKKSTRTHCLITPTSHSPNHHLTRRMLHIWMWTLFHSSETSCQLSMHCVVSVWALCWHCVDSLCVLCLLYVCAVWIVWACCWLCVGAVLALCGRCVGSVWALCRRDTTTRTMPVTLSLSSR